MASITFRRIKDVLKDISLHWAFTIIIAQVIVIVVFPIIEILLSLPDQKPPWHVWLIVGVLHIAIGFYSVSGSIKLNDFLSLADVNQLEEDAKNRESLLTEEKRKVEILLSEINGVFRRQVALETSLLILNRILKQKVRSPSPEDIAKLIAPLIRDRSKALGFCNDELYNFALYLYDKGDRSLKIFYRECDDRIQRHDRVWLEGVGHVGIAFARMETLVEPDTRGDNAYKGKITYETDDQYYISFVSSPIFKGESTKQDEVGALVITSSRPGHFDNDDKIIIDSYSLLLSLYFSSFSIQQIGATNESDVSQIKND
jgi:hypothetical protein